MQRTADFHEQIADACLPQAARIVDDAAALNTAVDMLDADAAAGGVWRPIEVPVGHMSCKRDLKGRDYLLKLVQRETGQIEYFCRPGLDVDEL